MFSSREYVESVSQDETHSFSCSVWVSYLRRAKQKDRRQKLELGTETALGIPPPPYTHTQNLKLLHQLQTADSSFLSGKYFASCFLKLWKIIQRVSEAEEMGSLICSSRLETLPLFSAVKVGGNFSMCIITEDISGHDYLRSLRVRCFQGQRLVRIWNSWWIEGHQKQRALLLTHPTRLNEDIHISCTGSIVESKDFQ